MNTKLKHHLTIAIIIITLVVIFLPMLLGKHAETKMKEKEAIPTPPIPAQLEHNLQPKDITAIQETIEAIPQKVGTEPQNEIPTSSVDHKVAVITEGKNVTIEQPQSEPISIVVDRIEIASPKPADQPQTKPVNKIPDQTVKVTPPSTETKTAAKPTPPKKPMVKTVHHTPPTLSQKHLGKAKQYNRAWVVQLGSFSQPQHANTLVKRLRSEGFKAFGYSKVITNKIVNRVYIGPFSRYNDAKNMQNRLKTVMHINGIVVKFNPIHID